MNENAKGNAFWTALVAMLMLYYGWMVGGWVYPATASSTYITALDAFDWMLKIGGGCFLVVAIICLIGLRIGLLLDAIVSLACGLTFITCCAIWIVGDGLNLQNLVYLAFGALFLNAARRTAGSFFATRSCPAAAPGAVATGSTGRRGWFGAGVPDAPPSAKPPEPPHPASIRPKSLPKDGEPPPPDGYLAALSKEDEEPPTASFE